MMLVHDGLCEVCMQLKLHAQLTVTSLTAPRLFCNPWNSGLITAGQAKPFSANMVLALAMEHCLPLARRGHEGLQ